MLNVFHCYVLNLNRVIQFNEKCRETLGDPAAVPGWVYEPSVCFCFFVFPPKINFLNHFS